MKLITFAIDTPVGEIRRVGAIRKDGFFVDLAAGRELLLKKQGVDLAYAQAERDCPSDMLAFIRAGEDALNEWRDRANARLAAGQRRLEEGMMGRAALYEPIDNRRFHEDGRGYDAHEVEKAMLLDPNARLASTGYFEA